jgi:RNA polymerase sigma-70 factor (ECF subfamily)
MFADHRDAVWSYCYRRLDRSDVPDAVAEVFLAAWRRIENAPAAPETLAWLYGIARNVVRNATRSSGRRRRLHEKAASIRAPHPATPEVEVVRRAEDAALLAAVARLKPLEQELLRLRTWEELPLAEIAAATGLSVRAVESKLARVRKRLAGMLDVPTRKPARRPRPVEEGGE